MADPILYLVHRLPFPPDKGDRIRAFHLLQFLAKHGPVHLATLTDEPFSTIQASADAQANLSSHCERLAILSLPRTRPLRMFWSLAVGRTVSEGAFDSPALWNLLRSWCRETRYRVCFISASSMAPYLHLPELRSIPAIVDLVDVDSQKWLDYAAVTRPPRSWLYSWEARRLRRLEQELPAWTRAVTFVSESEATVFRQFARPGRIQVITNGVDLDYFRPDALHGQQNVPRDGGANCVFVGALDYFPNVDGVCWFCRQVWPEIHRCRPEARISLVGRHPTAAVRRLAGLSGVEVVGPVPDVRPYYARAAIVVAPLRLARGVQNKLLEALAMGKALVASSPTLRGLKAQPGVHLLRADSPEEWQNTIVQLLEDRSLRQRLGEAGRRHVEDNYRWDHCLEPLEQLL